MPTAGIVLCYHHECTIAKNHAGSAGDRGRFRNSAVKVLLAESRHHRLLPACRNRAARFCVTALIRAYAHRTLNTRRPPALQNLSPDRVRAY
jgi:hypothetical protein